MCSRAWCRLGVVRSDGGAGGIRVETVSTCHHVRQCIAREPSTQKFNRPMQPLKPDSMLPGSIMASTMAAVCLSKQDVHSCAEVPCMSVLLLLLLRC